MKRLLILFCATALMQGCASLMAGAGSGYTGAQRPSQHLRTGNQVQITDSQYPSVAVTPDGGHAIVMPPCGNMAVVVNPDGTHSLAVINGPSATIVTP